MTSTKGPRKKIPVAVLGATGAVGQTFIRLLQDHPWFELHELAASERSSGKAYGSASRWLEGVLDPAVSSRTLTNCDPTLIESPIVFSALDSSVAGDIESCFAAAGKLVLSNARNFRMEADVPLVIPEINPDHLQLLDAQRAGRGWKGAIVTNPNCATIVAAMALAPLHERFGISEVSLVTMQAVSGAGYPGVPSLDILGNVIPFIADEEGKLESEPLKILGRFDAGRINPAPFRVSAQANRVPVEHGHTVCMSVRFKQPVSAAQAREAFSDWKGAKQARELPSLPERVIAVTDQPDRPQPRRDVNAGKGMTVTIGRIRDDTLFHLKLVALGHNTVRGAAGASVLNAELMVAQGLIPTA